jgi:hypothetical protein
MLYIRCLQLCMSPFSGEESDSKFGGSMRAGYSV